MSTYRWDVPLGNLKISAEISNGQRSSALIGMNVLGQFVFGFDGPNKMLWLFPFASTPATKAANPQAPDSR